MTSPTISVLMSVYNGEKYLAQAIESILAQTFPDFEFLIVDDASTDNAPSILQDFARRDPRIRLVHNQTNKGLTVSLECLMENARGEFISRMDADDISLPMRFELQVARFGRQADLGALGTWTRYVRENGTPECDICYPDRHKWIARRLEKENCYVHGSMMFRHACLRTLGAPVWRFRYAQDQDLYLRLLDTATQFGFVEEVLYIMRSHNESISSKFSRKFRGEYAAIMKELHGLRRNGIPEYDWRQKEASVLSANSIPLDATLDTLVAPAPSLRRKMGLLVSRLPVAMRRHLLVAWRICRLPFHPNERFFRWHPPSAPL